ncbi:MAG: O-antigen ligase family protein [Nitrosospira sp.]|nr:O-antigen ligase family protein [Nitrosospira sp.]
MRADADVHGPENGSYENLAGSSRPPHSAYSWRDVLPKFALCFFGIALWSKGITMYAYYFLALVWILDSGLGRFGEVIKEPFVATMLILCIVVALGILWGDNVTLGYKVWKRYFAFLIFIPYFSLLGKTGKKRLPWAIGGLLLGYSGVLLTGIYQWITMDARGIPLLRMTYLDFSCMLGIGVILSIYLAGTRSNNKTRLLLWLLAVFLLFVQFNQNARALLLATLISSVILIFLLHKKEIRTFLAITASLIIVVGVFAYTSSTFQERLLQAQRDIELSQQEKYNTSLGYRLAMWDVGLHGIAERPLFGHGTGMAARYFDKTAETYKGGLYKDVPEFITTYHYHNDWIEIGMQVGAIGLLAYASLLWGWFQTLRTQRLTILGATLMCFILLFGLTDVFVIFTQNLYLLLAITAIAVCWQKTYGPASFHAENRSVRA